MKSELINLLHRLSALAPASPVGPLPRGVHGGFQSLTIFPNGTSHAQYRWGLKQFQTLTELEALAYPDSALERGLQAASTTAKPDTTP